MNKLAIPAILAATILVAGGFAFSPVQQASTVHQSTTTLEDQTRIVTVSGECEATADNSSTECDTIEVDVATGAAFEILGMRVEKTNAQNDGNADAYDLAALEVNGFTTTLDPSALVTADTTNDDDWVINDDLGSARVVGIGEAAVDDIRIDNSAGTTVDDDEKYKVTFVLMIDADAADPTVNVLNAPS